MDLLKAIWLKICAANPVCHISRSLYPNCISNWDGYFGQFGSLKISERKAKCSHLLLVEQSKGVLFEKLDNTLL